MEVLFDVGDPFDSDGFFSEVSRILDASLPGVKVTGLCFQPREELESSLDSGKINRMEFLDLKSESNGEISLDVVTASVAFRKSPKYESTRFVAIKLLNRADVSGTFRFLEREIFFHRATFVVLEMLLRHRPSLIVFRVTPHEFLPFVVWRVAEFLGIEVLHFQPSSVSPSVFPFLSSGRQIVISSVSCRSTSLSAFIRDCSKQTLASLAAKRPPSYMLRQVDRDSNVTKFFSRINALRHSVKWLFSDRFQTGVDFSGHAQSAGLLARLLKMLLTRSLILNLREQIRNLGGVRTVSDSFALFALHYEPERTSIPEGLPIEHQADAVAEIRSFLPANVQLVVKEHYSQQSSALRGFLGRSPLFYRLIEMLPGTLFASFSATSSELVSRSECVVTLTGTIGVEAAFAGKPVIYFGSPWWAGMPGSVRMNCLNDYSELSEISVPEAGVILRYLENKILDASVPGLASESVVTMEQRFGKLPADFRMVEARALAHCVKAAVTLP